MKHARRLTTLLLAVLMTLSMSVSAFAAGGPDPAVPTTEKGTITIVDALYDSEYSIYRIADLESYNKDNNFYSYKLNADWTELMEWKDGSGKSIIKDVYLKYQDDTTKEYITWAKNPSGDDDWRAFAKLCKQFADAKGITPVATKQTGASPTDALPDARTSLTFDNLDLGYYLVDSSAGLVCSLDTTDTVVEIKEKNIVPTVTKQVKEDSNGLASENDADIGQIIEYQSNIKIRDNNNVIFHDKMSAGLDFVYDAASEWNNSGTKPDDKADNITIILYNETDTIDRAVTLVEGTHYTVTPGALAAPDPVDDCTFHIKFSSSVYDAIKAKPKSIWHILVTYHGMLNAQAEIGPDEGNPNTCRVTYGDTNKSSNEAKTVSKTYEFKVFKYTNGTMGTKKGLEGAEFTLKLNSNGEVAEISEGVEISFVVVDDGKTDPDNHTEAVYRVATPEELADGSVTKVTTIVTNKTGKFVIRGLDASSYLLTETKAPDGFNKLDQPAVVTIGKTGTPTSVSAEGYYEIQNNSGAKLPSTGGIGTTIFYAVGGAMVLAAVVLLVTKKRMSD